ncbi:hypothetical protein HMSSN036_71890 [Paenibacillus macerans]|nr:hypothetical protein HMSSN036_71890 [Paenibacillus macerans]
MDDAERRDFRGLLGLLQYGRHNHGGENSYASLAEYWQQAENSSNDLERAIARRMNEIPKVVISHSEVDLVWRNSEQILVTDEETLARELEALKTA